MKHLSFEIVIEKEPDDPGYYAYSPALPGCFSAGLTVESTRENMREAIELHLEAMIADGESIPLGEELHVEELLVGVPERVPACRN